MILLQALEASAALQIIPLSDVLDGRTIELFHARPDKGWRLTDCISFLGMGDYSLTDALTADKHFEQARFRALLRTPDVV